MSIKNDLKKSILKILKDHRVGSYESQDARRQILIQFADELVPLGYGLRNINGLKEKHILAIVKFWQKNALAVPTIKNRTSALRFLCKKINKPTIIPSNKEMSIPRRIYVPVTNRALHNPDFSKISNIYIHISLELQRVFGLRREEALKIKPHMADKNDRLELLSSWCKGGRGRVVPIRTDEQRYWLDQATKLAGKFGHSFIPQNKSYKQQRDVYDKQVNRAGLRNLHGLRHAYAQQRYKELTGWESPINGGPKLRTLTQEQKDVDHQARMILSEELGHSRKQIMTSYLGV
jgi:site-specific recombinase XerD